MDFQPKVIKCHEGGHFIFIKGKIHQGKVSILNIYAPNARTPKFIKETLLKLKTHIKHHIIIVGDFKILLSAMGRSLKNKLNKEIVKLRKVMNQMDLTDICRLFHPKIKQILLNTSWNLLQN
jgi:exonuclease III